MNRLTINKKVNKMNMLELTHNCMYIKDKWSWYRDYDIDESLIDFIVEISHKLGGNIVTADSGDNEAISEELWDNLNYGYDNIDGIIALLYTRLAALANLRQKLAEYEDLEEQNKLLKLPCAIGDLVYTNISMSGWYFRKENRPYKAKIVYIGINGADNYMNIDLGNGHMLQFKFSDIGKTVFLTKEEAKAAL